jgi:hypothetical protein
MRPRRLAHAAMPILALATSQVGHLVASELKQGPGALAVDSSGVHRYVPTVTTLALAVAGIVVLAALMVVVAARYLRVWQSGPSLPVARRLRRGRWPAALDAAAAMFVLQLAVYTAQEWIELTVAGQPSPNVATLLLWGALGQLPLALVAGFALSWLQARFEVACAEIAAAPALPPPALGPCLVVARAWTPPARAALMAQAAGPALAKRGPPSPLPPG